MKIMHEHVDFPGRSTIKIKWREMPHFTYPWHFHSEFELLYVLEGFGTSFVADSIEKFQAGDMVLLGTNLPHFWHSDESYLSSNGKLKVKYIVVQFPNDLFKEPFSLYPEFHLITELLKRSSRGIRFSPTFSEKAAKKVNKLSKKEGFDRIILFLEFLQFLAKTNDYKLLAGELYHKESHDFTSGRLTKVMHFLNTNYQQKIELDKVADIANLHPSAFCRFFKEKTGKSLLAFVNDMRISYACKLLIEAKLSVSQVCFESGFNNLSNFNRNFKKHTSLTPSQYQLEFHLGNKSLVDNNNW